MSAKYRSALENAQDLRDGVEKPQEITMMEQDKKSRQGVNFQQHCHAQMCSELASLLWSMTSCKLRYRVFINASLRLCKAFTISVSTASKRY